MISNKKQYNAINYRIEELLKKVDNDTPKSDPHLIELDLLSSWVATYEEKNFPVKDPDLSDIIKLRMDEKGLTQTQLSKMLGVSRSALAEYLSGKIDPPLRIARKISLTLDIDPAIILGAYPVEP